jgi:hypothetical protein
MDKVKERSAKRAELQEIALTPGGPPPDLKHIDRIEPAPSFEHPDSQEQTHEQMQYHPKGDLGQSGLSPHL